MEFIYGTCATCGTQTLVDPETEAEVHFDVTYKSCGAEGKVTALADALGVPISRPALRAV